MGLWVRWNTKCNSRLTPLSEKAVSTLISQSESLQSATVPVQETTSACVDPVDPSRQNVLVPLSLPVPLVLWPRLWDKCTNWHLSSLKKIKRLKVVFRKSQFYKRDYLNKLRNTLMMQKKKKKLLRSYQWNCRSTLAKPRSTGTKWSGQRTRRNK